MKYTDTDIVLAEAGFEKGFDLYRDGEHLRRIPSCTYWDDDAYRIVNRGGTIIRQRRVFSGTRSLPTDEWEDCGSLGPIAGVSIEFDNGRIEILH
jgi:hypothetical protein